MGGKGARHGIAADSQHRQSRVALLGCEMDRRPRPSTSQAKAKCRSSVPHPVEHGTHKIGSSILILLQSFRDVFGPITPSARRERRHQAGQRCRRANRRRPAKPLQPQPPPRELKPSLTTPCTPARLHAHHHPLLVRLTPPRRRDGGWRRCGSVLAPALLWTIFPRGGSIRTSAGSPSTDPPSAACRSHRRRQAALEFSYPIPSRLGAVLVIGPLPHQVVRPSTEDGSCAEHSLYALSRLSPES